VMMVDMDRFKQVNDKFGHYVGDRVLASVAHILQQAIRETDLVGRMGGDEFMIVLPGTPPEGAKVVADRILRNAASTRLHAEGSEIAFHLSIGIGALVTDDTEIRRVRGEHFVRAVELLSQRADEAMYSGKHSGEAAIAPALTWSDVLATTTEVTVAQIA
jgi:diguanylate cyclase (GGDEF)-like protein